MAKRIQLDNITPARRPSLTPEARENELIALAYDIAEEQLRNGTASSQVISYFLKLRNDRDKKDLEIEKLKNENELLKAKSKAYRDSSERSKLYTAAIKAMGIYAGTLDENEAMDLEKEEAYDELDP